MDKVIEKYNRYIDSYYETWTNRFTWRDSKNDPKHSTTMIKFFSDTGVLNDIEHVYTLYDMFQQVDKLGKQYVTWVKTKSEEVGSVYPDTSLDDMHRFFNGAMGEFFIVNMLTNVKCLYKCSSIVLNAERYDFNFVAPLLKDDKDLGVDLTCVANDIPSVIQVKWWNPYIKEEKPKMEVFQKAIADGAIQDYISIDKSKNIFLFWPGDEKYVDEMLNKNPAYDKECCNFGSYSIGLAIDNRNRIFWDTLYKNLIDLCKM